MPDFQERAHSMGIDEVQEQKWRAKLGEWVKMGRYVVYFRNLILFIGTA
jgi:hypothetical protein